MVAMDIYINIKDIIYIFQYCVVLFIEEVKEVGQQLIYDDVQYITTASLSLTHSLSLSLFKLQ